MFRYSFDMFELLLGEMLALAQTLLTNECMVPIEDNGSSTDYLMSAFGLLQNGVDVNL